MYVKRIPYKEKGIGPIVRRELESRARVRVVDIPGSYHRGVVSMAIRSPKQKFHVRTIDESTMEITKADA